MAVAFADDDERYRDLPANAEAEQALLAALLVNNAVFDRVSHVLRPEHFHVGVHGRVYEAIATLIDRGQRADPPSLKPVFDQDPALKDAGGSQYLARLAASVVTVLNGPDYARQIVDLAKRRDLISIGDAIKEQAYNVTLEQSAEDVIAGAEAQLYQLAATQQRGHGPVDARSSFQAAVDLMETTRRNGKKLLGVPSGIEGLDNILCGFQPENLYIIGGRPSMGKTTASRTFATSAARFFAMQAAQTQTAPKQVLEFELEMSHAQMSQCRIAQATGIPLDLILRGELNEDQALQVIDAVSRLSTLPIHTDDTPRLSLAEMTSRARRMARSKGGLGMIVVDHLGLVTADRDIRRQGEIAVLSEVTASLKALAKSLSVPVIALSQLSRDIEKREDKRPMLADLRYSGSIEQDADAVIFAYREEYYLSRMTVEQRLNEKDEAFAIRQRDYNDRLDRCRGKAELIVEKNRMGAIGKVVVGFSAASVDIYSPTAQAALPL